MLIPQSETQAFITEPGNHDWVSIIKCISGSQPGGQPGGHLGGQYRLPYLIFQGKQMQQSWISPGLNRETVI